MVLLNSPGNPLGNMLSRQEVEQINEIVDARSYIINDEIYNNVCFYEPYRSPLSYLPAKYREVNIVTNSLSKGFRLYTKRVGFALLPEPLQMPMRIVQQHTQLCCDPVVQKSVIPVLEDWAASEELCRLYRARAEEGFEQLSGTGCVPIRAEGGFYLVIDCQD